MTAIFSINKKSLAMAISLAGLFISLAIMQVRASANDSSITLKQDPSSKLFILTVRDPDGIQEFSMTPTGKNPYGGELSGCPKTFSINNVLFDVTSDFKPTMPAYVVDCGNNTANLEIAPPKDGLAKSTPVIKEEAPPPPPAPKEALKEEKKGGPLSASDISYPVPDLGNCQSEKECRSYCDNSQHGKECYIFAKKYNLITEKEAKEKEKEFFDVTKGPGGCNSGASCETYCNNVDHLDECIAFAEKSGYYSGDQLAEAKKFQELAKSGKQFPGGCKDRNTCELYCNDSQHMEECLNFAEETGFMPKEEIEQARKILPLIQKGETPGGCTSKEQCEKYCSDDSHNDECIAFGEKAGLISAEDAAMIKKTGGKGPGGCHSKQQCEAYCEANSDECFKWAQDNGLVSEDDLAKMKTGLSQFKEQLDKMPPEVTQCLKDAVGEKNFDKLVSGQPVFDRSLEGKMKTCFNQVTAQVSQQLNTLPPEAVQCIKDTIGEEGLKKLQSGEFDKDVDFSSLEGCFQQLQSSFGGGQGGPGGGPGGPGGGGFAGPGGCKSIDECTAYCQDHQDECQTFVPPGGGGPGGPGGGPNTGGPGGSSSASREQCSFMDWTPVCAVYKGDADFTFNNECWLRINGGTFKHAGVCPGDTDCGKEGPGTVCARNTDGSVHNFYNKCVVRLHDEANPGVKILHEGECTKEELTPSGGGDGGGTGGVGGPGGCRSQEECQAYCQEHPAECGGGGGGGGTGGGGGAVCDYAQPPAGCTLIPGPNYNSQTKCGLVPSCPTAPKTQSCVPAPSGLVSWWNGDSLSGASGGVISVAGKVGNAFKFDGASGYINVGNPANLNFGTGPFSLEAWFNWTGEGAGQVVNNIIRKSNYGPDAGSGYWLRIGQQLEFSVGATTQSEGQTLITAPVSPGVWHHAVGTKDSSGNVQLYVDGRPQGTIVRQAANTQSTSGSAFTIGAWDDQHSEFFHGMIDEVSVYNRALSASEVQAIFNAGGAGKCSASSGTAPSPSPTDILQSICPQFAAVPSCDLAGPAGSQNYNYCKQCYPDK